MLGVSEGYAKVPWFWSDQFDMSMQIAGLFDQAAPIRTRETTDDTCLVFQCDRAGRLAAAAGIGRAMRSRRTSAFSKLIEREAVIDPDTGRPRTEPEAAPKSA
ncbi:MAG: oxidoreductase C-terminal domain-containing protein [Geminicoccaceae bacterium]